MVVCSYNLRPYQQKIVENILKKGNTLVVLPTGTGKSFIGYCILEKRDGGIFLSPTKPLCKQHYEKLKNLFKEDVELITGESKKREYVKKVIVATPQTIEKDMGKKINLNKYPVIIFDEAHRAVGNYSYVKIAKNYNKLIVGLTASPGGDIEKINEVIKNLKIKNIEIYDEEDLKEWVKEKETKIIYVSPTPKMKLISNLLKNFLNEIKENLAKIGIKKLSKKELSNMIKNYKKPDNNLINMSIAFHILHMIELIESNGEAMLKQYLENLDKNKKTTQIILNNKNIKKIIKLLEEPQEHPKIGKLLHLVKSLKGKRGFIFAQYTKQIEYLKNLLTKNNINAEIFVGKRKMKRKEQERIINKIKKGEIDILVTSPVGEEGIDLPELDFVIFFEPIPSEIRNIQRRGRVGRQKKGEIYILVTKNTIEESFLWSAIKKEKKMKKSLKKIKEKINKLFKNNNGTILNWIK